MGLTGFDRRRKLPSVTVAHSFSEGSTRLRGGARIGWSNASYPFARLVVDHEWCRIDVTLLGPVWLARSEIWQVRRVQSWLGSPGVMFDAEDHRFDGLVFWTLAPSAVLGAFAAAGWPIEPPSGPILPGA